MGCFQLNRIKFRRHMYGRWPCGVFVLSLLEYMRRDHVQEGSTTVDTHEGKAAPPGFDVTATLVVAAAVLEREIVYAPSCVTITMVLAPVYDRTVTAHARGGTETSPSHAVTTSIHMHTGVRWTHQLRTDRCRLVSTVSCRVVSLDRPPSARGARSTLR
jgi:hypothetical protein